jgi:hypothetical protein
MILLVVRTSRVVQVLNNSRLTPILLPSKYPSTKHSLKGWYGSWDFRRACCPAQIILLAAFIMDGGASSNPLESCATRYLYAAPCT